MEKSYSRAITIAGLCHNLGNGPFSHAFDQFVSENLNMPEWKSTDATMMLIDSIIDTKGIDIESEEVNLIKDLIIGENRLTSMFSNNHTPNWIFQILNNKTNAVDVDKFEFITRDTYKLGVPNQSFDHDILLSTARVIDDNICYRDKDAFSLYQLFQCRYRLFKEFYLHRVIKGIDLMIKDMFAEANSVYDFKSCLNDPETYIHLNDSILGEIHYTDNPDLEKAKKIVSRIYYRDLYKYVGEYTSASSKISEKFRYMTADDLVNFSSSEENPLRVEDIRIMKYSLDCCKGEEDPISFVKFYDKLGSDVKHLARQDVSLLISNNFNETIVRVYVTDQSKLKAAKSAFIKFCNEKTGETPHPYEKSQSRMSKSPIKFPKKLFQDN